MTSLLSLSRLRRAVSEHGLTPAATIPEGSEGRNEEATIRPARVVEDTGLVLRDVGGPEAWPDPVAFLDGVQHYHLLAYAGTAPLVIAEVAAAVMERNDRRLRLAEEARRALALARPAVLDQLSGVLDGLALIPLPETEPAHPARDFILARQRIDAARSALEVEVGERFRPRARGWLVVDGSLTETPAWGTAPRMLGVAKSHATLPFEGADLERYLRLPVGHRTSVFAPESHRVTPVYSWALRLWPWEGRDLLYGLIRVETAPTADAIAAADQISRWLLAERAPVSTPDQRWDRLLYGIHQVEAYLKVSRSPVTGPWS